MVVQRDRSEELYQIFNNLLGSGANGDYDLGDGVGGETHSLTTGLGQHRPDGAMSLQSSHDVQAFSRYAQKFSKDIAYVCTQIGKLAELFQRQNVFDDKNPEISGLTRVVKGSLQQLHNDLDTLKALKAASISAQRSTVRNHGGAHVGDSTLGDATKHSDTVVNTLTSRLAETGQQFRTVLEGQARSMKDNASRRNKFVSDRPQTVESALRRDQENMETQQQLQVSNSTTQYYQQRADAVQELEGAITEIGELFQDLTRLVHEQEELMVRIDDQVDHSLDHVNAGSNELLRYLNGITSNRGLITKILGILFVFLLFFGFVVVR